MFHSAFNQGIPEVICSLTVNTLSDSQMQQEKMMYSRMGAFKCYEAESFFLFVCFLDQWS